MYSEIKLRWFCPTFNIGVTDDRKVYYLPEGKITPLKPHYHQGQTKYYLNKKRISQRQINADSRKTDKVIREDCPF